MFSGRTLRMKPLKRPRQLLAETRVGKRSRGRPCRAIRVSFVDDLKLLVRGADERGDLKDWRGFAKNEHEWKWVIMNRIRAEKGEFGDGDD